jgi:hypothetical protein
LLDTLTIRGQIQVDTHELLLLYQQIERVIRGSQQRMLMQLESKGWPVPRASVFDEFNGIRRTACNGIIGICLATTQNYSTGSSAN